MTHSPYIDKIPFAVHLGFELARLEADESELRYTPTAGHLNTFGSAHGGAAMSLLDITMAAAAHSSQSGSSVVTIEMKTTFIRPSMGRLSARGKVIHRTARLAFVEASIFDADERLCARATGTFKYVVKAASGP